MIKKGLIIAATILLLSTLLCGCNGGNNQLIKEAQENVQQFASGGLSKSELHGSGHGKIAIYYLEHIQKALPGRIAGSEKERETAVFLLSAILEMGYSEDSISVQDFAIEEGATPMQDVAPEDIISGGKSSDHSQNIIVTKKGQSEKIIIVGAHYDSAGTHGIDDNGSGVSVALESAMNTINIETPYTIRYIFFGAEEIGMCGSRAYVETLSQTEKDNILLMINIDTIFAGDICYLYGGQVTQDKTVKDDFAVKEAYKRSQELSLDISLPPKSNADYPFPTGQKRSDHAPFSDIGIPYIYFESNNWSTGSQTETEKLGMIMHTKNDDLEFINSTFGGRGQRALTAYATLLDSLLKAPLNNEPAE